MLRWADLQDIFFHCGLIAQVLALESRLLYIIQLCFESEGAFGNQNGPKFSFVGLRFKTFCSPNESRLSMSTILTGSHCSD